LRLFYNRFLRAFFFVLLMWLSRLYRLISSLHHISLS